MQAILRRYWRIEALGGVVLLLLIVPAGAEDVSSRIGTVKWSPWVELGGSYGSNDTSRGEAALWAPIAQSAASVLFGEARGKLFHDDMREGNFALGYRQMMPGGWNLGLWGGYDIRESQHNNSFHQFTGGIEALSDRWDFRANAYLPLNDSENLFSASSSSITDPSLEFTGSTIGLVTTTTTTNTRQDELALWGFDAEIGAKIFSTPLDLSGLHHELRVYAGAYHFDHSDLPSSVTGPRVRAEWRMDDIIDQWAGSRLTLEAEYSHDQLRNDRVEVGARLRLPFGDSGSRIAARSLTAQERRMSDGLERDTDIVTDTRTTSSSATSSSRESVEDAKTGVRFDRVASVDSTGDLTTTSAAAGANSLIIADGSAGNIGGSHTLEGDQTLQGGGSTIQVRGVTSGMVADFTAPGTRPTLTISTVTTPGDVANLTLGGSNTRVTGLDIDSNTVQPFSRGIVGNAVSNVIIADVTIRNAGQSGIWFSGQDNVSIVDVSITNAFRGMTLADGTFFISNTTIDGITGFRAAILIENANLTANDVQIRNAPNASGIALNFSNNTAVLNRVLIENVGFAGVRTGGGDLTLNDSTLAGTMPTGIYAGVGTRLSGTGNTASGATFTTALCDAPFSVGSITFDIGTCP